MTSFIFKFSNLDNSFQHVTKMQQNSCTFLLESSLTYNEIWLSPFTDDHQTTDLSKSLFSIYQKLFVISCVFFLTIGSCLLYHALIFKTKSKLKVVKNQTWNQVPSSICKTENKFAINYQFPSVQNFGKYHSQNMVSQSLLL